MKAIDIIKYSIATHKDWAAYFEKHPEMQELEKHKEIGDAAWHRARIKDYEQAISEIEQLQAELDKYKDALATKFNAEMCEALKPIRDKLATAKAENQALGRKVKEPGK